MQRADICDIGSLFFYDYAFVFFEFMVYFNQYVFKEVIL